MTKEVLIRPFVHKDFAAIFAIERTAQIAPWSERMLLDSIAANHQVWVLQNDNVIAGFIIFNVIAGECHILNLCVDPKQQGKGFGKQLLLAALEYAKDKGADMALLEVRESNRIAIDLYGKVGFNEIGIRKNYYPLSHEKGRENAIVFALEMFRS